MSRLYPLGTRSLGWAREEAMEKTVQSIKSDEKVRYTPPSMKKHEAIKIVQGTGHSCGLYYTSLYYYYYY
jgi:hypothetical protein